jgi:hypothetical protein
MRADAERMVGGRLLIWWSEMAEYDDYWFAKLRLTACPKPAFTASSIHKIMTDFVYRTD